MNYLIKSALLRTTAVVFIAITLGLCMHGCVRYQYQPEVVNVESISNEINSWRLDNPDLNEFLESNGITQEVLDSRDFSVKRLYLTGLYYSPEMKIAYKQWQKAQIVAEHSGYRINPEIGIPFEHHSDTSAGQSAWTIGAVFNFTYERKGKRQARRAEAEMQLLNAKLLLESLAIDSYLSVEKAYHAYITGYARMSATKNEINILRELLGQLQEKYESGRVSQFEISSITLELQKRLFELNLQENLMQEYKDCLLAMTYLPPAVFENISIKYVDLLGYTRELYQNSDSLESNLEVLQAKMLANNIEMALQLNSYAQSEARLQLEIEKQYPDIVLSPGFVFDQADNLWVLGTAWVLPLFKNSAQNMEIRKALEDRKIRQQQIVALQKQLLNSLYQKHRSILRHYGTLGLSDEIIIAIEQRASLIQEQLALGGADSIDLLRNRLEFYQAKETQTNIYHDATNALLQFEQFVQGFNYKMNVQHVVASWINKIKQ